MTRSIDPSPTPVRLPSLDGLRAVAVAIVMLSHATRNDLCPSWLKAVMRYLSGEVGVQIFFVISGFIITHLLLHEWDKTGVINLKAFWRRRALRILPPLLMLLATLSVLNGLGWISVAARTQWASLFFFRNHVDGGWMNGHLWSLSVEEQFYLFWPLLLLAGLHRLIKPGFVLMATGAVVIRTLFLSWHCNDLASTSMLASMDCLALGGWLAWHHSRRPTFWPDSLLNWLSKYWAMLVIVILTFNYLKPTRFFVATSVVQPFFVGLGVMLLIRTHLHPNDTLVYRLLNHPWMVVLGRMSYSLYLWQQLFICPPEAWRQQPWLLAKLPWNFAASLLVGWLSFRLIERPFARLRLRPVAMLVASPEARSTN